MARYHNVFVKKETIKFVALAVVGLLILSAGIFICGYFILNKDKLNKYLIENKYYGFELKTPKDWIAEGKTLLYSEENISKLLTDCKNDKLNESSVYEVGRFRFKNQRYPQGFGDIGNFPTGFPSGAILDITVNCVPDHISNKNINSVYGNSKIDGEKTFEAFLNLIGLGKTKYLSFFHNNFQYRISEYSYISPVNTDEKEKLRNGYSETFNEIISSFKFVN